MAAPAEVLENSRTFNREQRLYNDTTTFMAEVLGPMRTSFEYEFDGHELYASDGSPAEPIFDNAIRDAERTVANKPNLLFELRRRHLEAGEYPIMLAMCRGEAPNTMVIVSDFPPELLAATKDIGGYDVKRKPAMLRVLALQPTGTLRITTQSLDGSDRAGLEAIYHECDQEPADGELLGQRIQKDLTPDEQAILIDRLTGVYDRVLTSRCGQAHYAGRPLGTRLNAYDFVCQQTDLLQEFTAQTEHLAVVPDTFYYNLAAALSRRYEQANIGSVAMRQVTLSPQAEMLYAGDSARLERRTFSGCGLSLRATEANAKSELESLGYGNRTDDSEDYDFDQEMHCVVCQAPPKKGEAKKMCGPCGICRTCDTKIRTRNISR